MNDIQIEPDTTLEEDQAINALKRLSKRWPKTLVLLADNSILTVAKRRGLRDIDNIARIDIEAYGEYS